MSAKRPPAMKLTVSTQPPTSRPENVDRLALVPRVEAHPAAASVEGVVRHGGVGRVVVVARRAEDAGGALHDLAPGGVAATSTPVPYAVRHGVGVSMRFCPWIVAMPVVRVSGVSHVELSEKPTHHVGSAAAIASKSSRSSRSMAVSPPHGGTTARIAGSSSMRHQLRRAVLARPADVGGTVARGVVELAHDDLEALVAQGLDGIREAGPEVVGDAGARGGDPDAVARTQGAG